MSVGEEFIGGGAGMVKLINTSKEKTFEGNYGQFNVQIKPGEESGLLSRTVANSFMARGGDILRVLDLDSDTPLKTAEEAGLETRPNHAKSLYDDDEDEKQPATPAKSAQVAKPKKGKGA